MRVLLTTYGSRGDVGPMLGLAVRLRELGAPDRRGRLPARVPAGRTAPWRRR